MSEEEKKIWEGPGRVDEIGEHENDNAVDNEEHPSEQNDNQESGVKLNAEDEVEEDEENQTQSTEGVLTTFTATDDEGDQDQVVIAEAKSIVEDENKEEEKIDRKEITDLDSSLSPATARSRSSKRISSAGKRRTATKGQRGKKTRASSTKMKKTSSKKKKNSSNTANKKKRKRKINSKARKAIHR